MTTGRRVTRLTTHEFDALNDACKRIEAAFDEYPYLVGTAGIGEAGSYRDVDIRLILDDERFDELFPREKGQTLWELLSLSIGAYLRERTGLPIDFQIQRQTQANEKHSKPRNPMGTARNFAAGGDGTPPWGKSA